MLILNIIEALKAIRANFLRTVLTILVIAIGLTALIGVLTAIDGVKFWFSDSFVRLGANTFTIANYTTNLKRGGHRQKTDIRSPITYKQAIEFKKGFGSLAPVSIAVTGKMTATCKYGSESTDANLQLIGSDEQFLTTDNYTVDKGRNLNTGDVEFMTNSILVGDEVVRLLFPQTNPLGKKINVDGKTYNIVGTLARLGTQGPFGGDKVMIIPATTLQKDFPESNRSFEIHVLATEAEEMDNLIFEAVGTMRDVRNLAPKDENDFGISKVDSIVANFMENIRFLTWSATLIALITLLSAAIGLLNNMLVSVTERTREIGVRKALGATRGSIQFQFLTEAVVITQLGGLFGILMGIGVGNLASYFLGSGFIFPWRWAILGLIICLVVGVASGFYPAQKAAKLDPIDALRHE